MLPYFPTNDSQQSHAPAVRRDTSIQEAHPTPSQTTEHLQSENIFKPVLQNAPGLVTEQPPRLEVPDVVL